MRAETDNFIPNLALKTRHDGNRENDNCDSKRHSTNRDNDDRTGDGAGLFAGDDLSGDIEFVVQECNVSD